MVIRNCDELFWVYFIYHFFCICIFIYFFIFSSIQVLIPYCCLFCVLLNDMLNIPIGTF